LNSEGKRGGRALRRTDRKFRKKDVPANGVEKGGRG